MHDSTETLSTVFSNAQQEARRLDESEAGRILAQMNLACGHVRNALAHTLPAGEKPPIVNGQLPMSPKAQRVVTTAIVEAQAAGQAKVSTRFVMAALLAEASGIVCETFRRSGADSTELVNALHERQVTPEA
jgi:ATP-dependent Clp protease ATP-binding subunit ClpA